MGEWEGGEVDWNGGVTLRAALAWINVLSSPLLLLCSGLLPDGVGEYRKSMKSKSILYKSILK